VQVDAEAPAMVDERDWTIEVVVGHEQLPLACCEQAAQCVVASIDHLHIVVVTIAECHCIEEFVDAADIVVVDVVEVVEYGCAQTEGVGHTVGQESCVVAH